MNTLESKRVLIVGGGPTGLATSLLLSRHGVRSLLVERHPGTSVHPKARGLNVRTLELFRGWGWSRPCVLLLRTSTGRSRWPGLRRWPARRPGGSAMAGLASRARPIARR